MGLMYNGHIHEQQNYNKYIYHAGIISRYFLRSRSKIE